ncbi:MAG: WD40-repeat-containing domain protein, partial [Olpidium bornovanus]
MKDDSRVDREPVSHDYSLRAAIYNWTFKQVVSGCDGSVINVWFSRVHDDSEITAMAFDASDRRLITGGRNGTIRVFNFNNGQCIHELVKEDNSEVTGICYIDMKESQFIVTAGWNRHITMFYDDPDTFRIYPWMTIRGTGHREDIYDGDIRICNLVSGHVLHRMSSQPVLDRSLIEDPTTLSIDKGEMIFLCARAKNGSLCTLVSTGGDGALRFWNAKEGQLLWFWDTKRNGRLEGIYAMTTNAKNDMIITADAAGQVSVWDISAVCVDGVPDADFELPLLASWRAHVAGIVSVEYNEHESVVIT